MKLQQGDVLLEMVKALPENCKEVAFQDGIVLAEGEVTGHAHRVKGKAHLLQAPNGEFYLLNEDKVTVTHEEHKHFDLVPNIWKIGKVQEYDYLEMQARQVRD